MDTEEFNKARAEITDEQLVNKAQDILHKLCETGGRSFIMTVPPRIDDTDMIFGELINRYKKAIPMQLPVGVPKPNQLNEQTLWQTCPKCNGQGWMSKPSWITGDTNEWTSTSAMHVCDICWGAKIIQTPKSL